MRLALSLLFVFGVLVGGCGGTCDVIKMERHPHPDKAAPAKRIIARCGRAQAVMDVDVVPACLDKCFPASEGN